MPFSFFFKDRILINSLLPLSITLMCFTLERFNQNNYFYFKSIQINWRGIFLLKNSQAQALL